VTVPSVSAPYYDKRGKGRPITITTRRINSQGAIEVEHHRFTNDDRGAAAIDAFLKEHNAV
jgi:hypothetical protein